MNLTCYIVDDEQHAIDVLQEYIRQTPGLTLAGAVTDPRIALSTLTTGTPPDITFTDVDMPMLDGLQFARLIKDRTAIVFTTAYREHAPEAFEQEAIDYLLKPIRYTRFLDCVTRIQRRLSSIRTAGQAAMFVKTGKKGKLLRIAYTDILYIENALNYLYVHLAAEKIMVWCSFPELLAQLPAVSFSRIHKSYIVPHDRIRAMEQDMVILQNGTVLPVGESYRQSFLRNLNILVTGSKRIIADAPGHPYET